MTRWIMTGGFDESRHRASIAGRVIAEGGGPIAGARVLARGAEGERQSRTVANGLFWFEDLPDSEYTIVVEVSDGASGSHKGTGEATVQSRTGRTGAGPAWVDIRVGAAKTARRKGA